MAGSTGLVKGGLEEDGAPLLPSGAHPGARGRGPPMRRKGENVQSAYAAKSGRKMALTLQLRRFFRVAIAFFKGDAKWKARGLISLMLVLCGISTGLFVVISYTQRDLSTALSKKDAPGFYLAVWKFAGIIVVAAPLFAIYDYVQGLLGLEWRMWLTTLLISNYFAERAFFDIKMEGKLDNPDQRICEDVASFVSSTVSIIVVIAGKILNVGAFSGVLWSISPSLVLFLLGYSILGTYATLRIFGRKLMWLQFEGLQREADLRYSLVRVRENAEAIAFYRGEDREAASVSGFLAYLVLNIRERLVWNRHLSLFNNFYEYATIVIPSLIIAPQYFAGKVEFGVIAQTGFAFRTILSAMTLIISRFSQLSGLAAETERLDSLLSALALRSSRGKLPPSASSSFSSGGGGGSSGHLDLSDGKHRPHHHSTSSKQQQQPSGAAGVELMMSKKDRSFQELRSLAAADLQLQQQAAEDEGAGAAAAAAGAGEGGPLLLSISSRPQGAAASPSPSPSPRRRSGHHARQGVGVEGAPPPPPSSLLPQQQQQQQQQEEEEEEVDWSAAATAGVPSATSSSPSVVIDVDHSAAAAATSASPHVAPGRIAREEGPNLALRGVSVITPNLRQVLFAEGLDLALGPGESLLVMGPSGCGKSSLLRAISGLWSLGRGTIQAPPAASTFFLPQKAYMPLGSLREQLLFPHNAASSAAALHATDADLVEALRAVALEKLAAQAGGGGLDAECDWSDMLSAGEQQRVAFARLFLQRPKMAFLDEASSALDGANESRLYSLLKERVSTYVSVGHRTSLVKFHTLVLVFNEDLGWRTMAAEEYGRTLSNSY